MVNGQFICIIHHLVYALESAVVTIQSQQIRPDTLLSFFLKRKEKETESLNKRR